MIIHQQRHDPGAVGMVHTDFKLRVLRPGNSESTHGLHLRRAASCRAAGFFVPLAYKLPVMAAAEGIIVKKKKQRGKSRINAPLGGARSCTDA